MEKSVRNGTGFIPTVFNPSQGQVAGLRRGLARQEPHAVALVSPLQGSPSFLDSKAHEHFAKHAFFDMFDSMRPTILACI